MTEPQWKKASASPEKFLKAENYLTKAFSGVLEAMYPGETHGEKATPLVRLDFEGGSSLSIFGMEYRNDDGTYPFGYGTFIKSAEALGLEVQEAELDGVVTGIRLVKNGTALEKPILWIKGIEEKGQVGDATQTKPSYFKWGTLEKYESTATPAPRKKGGYHVANKPKAEKLPEKLPAPTPDNTLSDTLIDSLMEPKTIGELFIGLDRKYKVSELRATLEQLKEEGIVKQDGDNYSVT